MAKKIPTEHRCDRMRRILQNRQLDLTIICEDISDRHNVGAILRSCEAVGIQDVNFVYQASQFHSFGHRSGASAKKWMNLIRHSTHGELYSQVKEQGFRLLGTHLDPKSVSIHEMDLTDPSAIVLGNEKDGISSRMLELVDQTVMIPMQGMIQSLNVSVAAAVILYEAARQRRAKGMYPARAIDDPWIADMMKKWVDL